MRKRTRIAVVAAALLVAVGAPVTTGIAGHDHVAHASVPSGGVVTGGKRVGESLRHLLIGSPPVDRRAVINVVRRLRDRVPPEQRWESIDIACKVKDLTLFEDATPPDMDQVQTDALGNPVSAFEAWRQQEIDVRLKRLEGWQAGAPGIRASVDSVLEDLDKAEDHGDTALIGADLLCLSVGVIVDGQPG